MRLFPFDLPVDTVGIDILGPLQKSKSGCRFILVITDRFTKLTQAVSMCNIRAFDFAAFFADEWVFKYGSPASLVSDIDSQVVSFFFQYVYNIMKIANVFTTTYHPQANGKTEGSNSTLTAILRFYVEDHPTDWCQYVRAHFYAYNYNIYRTTNITPFEFVLSLPPSVFTVETRARRQRQRETKEYFNRRLEIAIGKAKTSLDKTQRSYKRNFYNGI